jgi:hypothetical protein
LGNCALEGPPKTGDFSLSHPCSGRVPVVALSFCLDHGVVSLSERRSRRCIFSPAIMLRHEGKAEGIFDCSPICLNGGMVFGEVVAGSGSVGQTALRRSEDETTRNVTALVGGREQCRRNERPSACTGLREWRLMAEQPAFRQSLCPLLGAGRVEFTMED